MADDFKSEDSGKNKLAKKVLATLSLKFFIPIICVVIAIIIFFGPIFIVIGTVLEWFDLSGSNNDNGEYIVYQQNNYKYWWPIGSNETTEEYGVLFASGEPAATGVTSSYGNRCYDIKGKEVCDFHSGIDIGNAGNGVGVLNVIATKDGEIYKTNNTCYDNVVSDCGGYGAGNHIVIKHSDGSYSKYFHLAKDSIVVSKGDNVKQGQVIAKMGNSGNSTGTHLHFQIEIGGNGSGFARDPMTLLSHDNYRPTTEIADNAALLMLHKLEGAPSSDGYYVVYDDGYGTLTVGHGVTLKNHASKFSDRGIDVSTLSKGSKLETSIVDDIEAEILDNMKNSIISILSSNDISLASHQVDALLMRMYNTGNISGFSSAYKKYGDTQTLYDNYMNSPVYSNGKYSEGLVYRREQEWNLFHNGIYIS